MRVGLIRVLTTGDQAVLHAHAQVINKLYPGLEITTQCIPDQYEGIHDDVTEQAALPKILRLAETMAPTVDAFFISCAADPAVGLVRDKLGLPVVGAGSACAAVARALGERIGVITLTSDVPTAMLRVLGPSLLSFIQPAGVNTTLDFFKPAGRAAALAAGEKLCRDGAEVIALACTGLSTINMAGELSRELAVPVVDPVAAGGCLLNYLSKQG